MAKQKQSSRVGASSPSPTPRSSSSSSATTSTTTPTTETAPTTTTRREGEGVRENVITGESLFKKANEKRERMMQEIVSDVILPKLNQAAENGLLTFTIKFLENSRDAEEEEEEGGERRRQIQQLVAATANAMQRQQQQQQQQQQQGEGNAGSVAENDTVVNELYFKLLRDYDGRRKLRYALRDLGISCKTARWGDFGVLVYCGWDQDEVDQQGSTSATKTSSYRTSSPLHRNRPEEYQYRPYRNKRRTVTDIIRDMNNNNSSYYDKTRGGDNDYDDGLVGSGSEDASVSPYGSS